MLYSPHGRLHSASPKNVPGPIRAAPRSRSHSVNLKNVHRLITFRSAGRSAVRPKNVLGPILEPPLSSKHCVDPKNVPGPIRAALRAQSHSVNLKNVHRPIRMSFGSSVTALPTGKMFLDLSWSQFCPGTHGVPEKCSWTYPKFARLVGHTLQSGKMFMDLPGIFPAPDCILSTLTNNVVKTAMIFRHRSARPCALTPQARPLAVTLDVWGRCRSSRLIPRHLSLPTLTPAFEDSRIPAIPQREMSSVAVPLRSGRSSCQSRSRESAPPDRGATHDRDRGPLDAHR
jgi:hypothetical protein